MPNILEMLEELTYRRSVRRRFFSLSIDEAAAEYGLSHSECSILMAAGESAFASSLPFANSMFAEAFPLSVECLELAQLMPDDGFLRLFDRPDSDRPREAAMADQLARWCAQHPKADALRILIGWEALQLISPRAKRGDARWEAVAVSATSAAWLVTSPADCDMLPNTVRMASSDVRDAHEGEEPAFYIVKPDPLARHKSRAQYWQISALVHAVVELNLEMYKSVCLNAGRTDDDTFELAMADFMLQHGISDLVQICLHDWSFS